MSITEGVRLGLDISRGARQESRADQQHQMRMKQAQEDAAYQARIRPLQEQNLQLGLRNYEGEINHREELRPVERDTAKLRLSDAQATSAYNEQVRPLQLEATQLGLDDARATAEYNKQSRPLDLQAKHEALADSRQARGQRNTTFENNQQDRDMALRSKWVQEQTPLEYARFQRTGKFSDRFLRESLAIGSPIAPLRLVDGAHIDALDTMKDLLDPRRPSNPYDGNKLFEAANILLSPELNNGGVSPHTGARITDKRIVAAYPAQDRQGNKLPGQLYVELEMTDENGEKYRAPLTVGRGSGDDEELKTVDLSHLIQRVNAQQMFSQALNQDQTARERLIAQGRKLNNPKDSKLKPDEISWQGRARKFEDVYEIFDKDGGFKTAEGMPLVSWEAFEWTQGDPQKLTYLRAAAKENQQILTEFEKLRRSEPAKAQQLLQEWVDPVELYELASKQGKQGKQGDGGKSQSILDGIGADGDKPDSNARAEREKQREMEAKERAEFFGNPEWHLAAELPAWAREEMTPQLWKERSSKKTQSLAQAEQEKSEKVSAALRYLATEYPELSAADKRTWVLQNAQYLNTETRKRLIRETQSQARG